MSSTVFSSSPELDRKSLKRPDGFAAAIRKWGSNLQGNARGVLIGVGVLAAVAVAAGVWSSRREGNDVQARNAWFSAQEVLKQELKKMAETMPAVSDSAKTDKKAKAPESAEAKLGAALEKIEFQALDVDAKFPESVRAFQALGEKYSGHRVGFESRLALGDLYFRHGQKEKALVQFKGAVDIAKGALDQSAALYSVASTLEDLKKYAEAIQPLERAFALGEVSWKGELMLALARCQDLAGNKAQSRVWYDRVITELPNSEFARVAEASKTQ